MNTIWPSGCKNAIRAMTNRSLKATSQDDQLGSPLPIEHCREYDGAAEHFARHGTLPNLMGSPGAIDWIEADPEAFEQRVREFKYAAAMEETERKTNSLIG